MGSVYVRAVTRRAIDSDVRLRVGESGTNRLSGGGQEKPEDLIAQVRSATRMAADSSSPHVHALRILKDRVLARTNVSQVSPYHGVLAHLRRPILLK